jgi:hypothetical protein
MLGGNMTTKNHWPRNERNVGHFIQKFELHLKERQDAMREMRLVLP